MIIDIAQLTKDTRDYEGEEPPSILGLEDDSTLRIESPVKYRLTVCLAENDLVVRGELSVDVGFVCVRCGDFFSQTVREPSFLEVVEAVRRDSSVDLTDPIRESIILAFPMHPMCDPGCRGVCLQCGANLNKRSCACAPRRPGDRWKELDNLRLA